MKPKFLGSRYIVKEFGGKPCPHCGNPMVPGTDRHPTKDHVIAKARGGTLEGDNCEIICFRCNQAKADKPRTAELKATGDGK